MHSQIRDLKIPPDFFLSRVKVFSSLDNELSLNIFSFENLKRNPSKVGMVKDAAHIFQLIDEIKRGLHSDDTTVFNYNHDWFSPESMNDYLDRVSETYVQTSNPKHFLLQNQLFHQVKGTEDVAVEIHPATSLIYYDASNQAIASAAGTAVFDTPPAGAVWITIAASNVLPDVLLKMSSMVLSTQHIDINRAHLDTVRDEDTAVTGLPETGYVTMLRLLVSTDLTATATIHGDLSSDEFLEKLKQDLKRVKWLDDATMEMGLIRYPHLGLTKSEVITGLCSLLHGPLNKINAQSFSSIDTILRVLDMSPHFIQQAESIASLFLEKFRPYQASPDEKPRSKLSPADFDKQYSEIMNKISKLHMESARILLSKMLDAVKLTLRTNIYSSNRYALSLRIHPSVMVNINSANTMPFGVLFSHGRHYNAFHCRFRDIARGGLRIVTPPSADQFVQESARQFDEAYGLSFAQQLKNKDIPEVSYTF